MATVTQYATYVVFFHNADEYQFALAVAGGSSGVGGLLDMSPNTAAGIFGISIPYPTGDMDNISKGIYFNGIYTTDGTTSVNVGWNNGTGGKVQNIFLFPNNDSGVVVPGVANSHGASSVGNDTLVKWSGSVVYMKGAQPTTATPTAIPQRKWIGGLELEPTMEGGFSFSGGSGVGCRDASRTMDGVGFAIRGQNAPGSSWLRRCNEFGASANRRTWERLYVRFRRVGTGNVAFWRCHSSAANAAGGMLVFNTSGQVDMYSVSSTSVVTSQVSTTGWTLNKWYKLDIIVQYPAGVLPDFGTVILFRNGTQIGQFTQDSTQGSMGTIGTHAESEIGEGCNLGSMGTSDAQVEYDLDDWIAAEWPLNGGVITLDSMDFLMGSHVRRTYNQGGTTTGYAPTAYHMMDQGNNPAQKLNSQLVSTTSGAVLTGNTDLPLLGTQDKATGVAVGSVAAIVGINSTNSANTDGQLGYNAAGAGNVMATIDETSSTKFNSVMFRPSGLLEPAEITPFLTRFTKSADANTGTINAMAAIAEEIGVWGQEDVLDPSLYPTGYPRTNNLHNAYYPNTYYAQIGPEPQCMVFAYGGTYTGTGTQLDITLPDACHMLFIRGLGVGSNGVKWFASSLGGHLGTSERVVPNMPVRVWFDDIAGVFKFTVAGTDGDVNQVGSTYQFIAFCDPGMRYCSAGAYNTPSNVSSRVNTLNNPNLLPEFAFIQREILGTGSSTEGLFVKGPGNTGTVGNQLNNASQLATFGSFSLGAITTGTNTHVATASQHNYLAFRDTEPGCGWNMLQILSYTGDGNASRVITLTPTSGRFPLFALVCPTSGAQAAIFRDPSHTATNSYTFNGMANTTTGITAGGVDSITVGISLNANGVIYNVFVIVGHNASWQNGLFYPPNCDTPDPWYNPPMDPPDVAVMGNGGLVLNGSVALTILKDVTGIYTLQSGKRNDTMYDRQTGQPSVDVKIPDPFFKTGYIGG